jgi:FkbM family methyltransferase
MRKVIRLAETLTGPFSYVDCGARGDAAKAIMEIFPDAHYVGFEPDAEECAKLMAEARKGYSFFPVAVGEQNKAAELFLTRNPGCSSLYIPNRALFAPFEECGPFFDVISTETVQIVALDDYLHQNGIVDIDFLELDTQGAELNILRGAQNFLKNSLMAVRVEVEFAEMYQKQPMFGDVDNWLRIHGFVLFDLERYHLRRKYCPSGVVSNEQIVWGQALYLRDFGSFAGEPAIKKQKLSKLAMIASYYGFHSYALEIINYLTQDSGLLADEEKDELERLSVEYILGLERTQNHHIVDWMRSLDRSLFHKVFRRWGDTLTKLCEAYRLSTRKQSYFWKD